MSEPLTHKFSMFFFWAFLDDKMAIENSSKAYELFKNKKTESPVEIIRVLHKVWIKESPGYVRSKSRINSSSGWVFKKQINFAPWGQFLKSASPDEIEVTIFAQILNFKIEEIAAGLSLPEGTIRYRLGKALRKLGAAIEGFENSSEIRGLRR